MKAKSKHKKIILILGILLGFLIYSNVKLNAKNTLSNDKDITSAIVNQKTFSKTADKQEIPDKEIVLNLEDFFSENPGLTNKDENEWTLLVTGDVMLGRSVNYLTKKSGDYSWPFVRVFDLLKDPDITFINLESPFAENCPVTNEGMLFCSGKESVEGLDKSGIDIASLANNHSYNHGQKGIDFSVKVLEEKNITPLLNGVPNYKNIKGQKVAFLTYNDVECSSSTTPCPTFEQLENDIKKAKAESDLVIIMFHWGVEYDHLPNQRQKELAYKSIDSGADLIVGNHAHWYQSVEIYKNKVIMYSHGNFVFDQMWSEKTKEGVVGLYKFNGKNLVDIEFIPVYIENYGQPKVLEGQKAQDIIQNLKEISYQIR